MRHFTVLMAAGLAFAATADPAYREDLTKWRALREDKLKTPTGWLSVAGLFWLHEGANTVGSDPLSEVVLPDRAPKHAGVMTLHGTQADWKPVTGPAVTIDEKSDPLMLGSLQITLIVR